MTVQNEKLNAAFSTNADKVVKVKELQEIMHLSQIDVSLSDFISAGSSLQGIYLSEKGGIYIHVGAYRNNFNLIASQASAEALATAIEQADNYSDEVKSKRIFAIRP